MDAEQVKELLCKFLLQQASSNVLIEAIDAMQADIDRLRKDAELLALVLASPETAAEELEDAARGIGTPRENLEGRFSGHAPSEETKWR